MPEENNNDQPFDKESFVAGIKAKYNGAADVALSVLGQENFDLRNERRELKRKLPKEGSVVLEADDAKKWQAYVDLGVDPKDLKAFTELGADPKAIKAALDKVPELEKTAKELSQMETYREVAAAHGYKVPVLKKLMAEHPDAEFSFKTEKDAKDPEKEHKVALIRTGDDKEAKPFTEFAAEHFADFLPALKADADTPQPHKVGNTPDPPAAKGSDPTPLDNQARAAQARYTQSHF